MHLVLIRDTYTNNETLGILKVESLQLDSIERAENDTAHPCVPEGTYQLVFHDSPKHPHTFALVNSALGVVHNPEEGKRSDILIHPANWARQLEGCIAPGKTRTLDETGWMITNSREAYEELMVLLPWELGHTIEIKSNRGLEL
jgi:hypothetical protein